MGIIKQQSIRSTVITYIGFAIGAVNMMFVMPAVFTKEQFGLIQVFISFAIQAVTLGSLGMVVVINKFMPYYKTHLSPEKRDLMTIIFIVGTIGMLGVIGFIYLNKETIISKFSKNSPFFVEYLYLLPLFTMGYFYSYTLELFNNNYFFSSTSSFVREIFYKLFNLFAAFLFALGWLDFTGVINCYSIIYWIGALLLGINLYFNNLLHFPLSFSRLTVRLKKHLIKYSLTSWGVNIFSAASQLVETFALAGLLGLGPTAVYKIAQFLISPVVIPNTSIVNASIPAISDAWRRNDKKKIEEIYKKSALISVLVCGLFFALILFNSADILHLMPPKFFSSENEIRQVILVILILGFARLIDFSTSINTHIFQTSKKYYTIDLYVNIFLVILTIPINYFMIKYFRITGAAYAYLTISLFSNSFKTIFLYAKERLIPFSSKWILIFFVFIVCCLTVLIINAVFNYIFKITASDIYILLIKIFIRSGLLIVVSVTLIYYLHISEEINKTILSVLRKSILKIHSGK